MNSSKNPSTGSIAVLAALVIAAGAGAADRTATAPDISAKYSDVQVNSEADAEALYKKLSYAARKACGANFNSMRPAEERKHAAQCVEQALEKAVRKINQPLLTTVHQASTDKSGNVG
jgi:UrcA family protein